jgi:anaerobic selenocysteine-containing dehydrogenase
MCPALCGVRVTTDGGVVTRLTGDPDHPLSRGYLCPKGRKMAALTDDPERLDEPMVRDRGGKLVTVDWDTAIGDLADRLAAIRDRFGPYAIGNYSGTMFDAAGRFAAQPVHQFDHRQRGQGPGGQTDVRSGGAGPGRRLRHHHSSARDR